MKTPFANRALSARRGFTLVELLAVLAIVGVLAAILIPVLGRARESAKASQCAGNLRQVFAAMMLWSGDNKGVCLPAQGSVIKSGAYWWWYGSGYSSGNQANGLSPLVGYLGLEADVVFDGQRALNKITVCPLNEADTRIGGSVGGAYGYPYVVNYWIMAHPTTPVPMPHQPVKIASLANPGKLVLMADAPVDLATWGVGISSTSSLSRMAELHGGKSNILWADGHVSLTSKSTITTDNIRP